MTPSSPSREADIAVLIGRFSLVHRGHEALLQAALGAASMVVVVLGSAHRARDLHHPFDWQERRAMLLAALDEDQRARVRVVPLRDRDDDQRWADEVERAVRAAAGDGRTLLMGWEPHLGAFHQRRFARWTPRPVPREGELGASALREVFFGAEDPRAALAVLQPHLSEPVRHYLQAWSLLPAYAERVAEHRAVAAYRARWGPGPHLTADALVQVGDRVLLVQRGGDIGRGLWALPGGFMEPGERWLDAALRELREETRLPLSEPQLRTALAGSAVFDDPRRSARGRLVTQAFHFRFDDLHELPEVTGADDAREARWVALDELPALEDRLFEDHFLILDRFLSLPERA